MKILYYCITPCADGTTTDGVLMDKCPKCMAIWSIVRRECSNCGSLDYETGYGCHKCNMGVESNTLVIDLGIANSTRLATCSMEPIGDPKPGNYYTIEKAAIKTDTGKPAMHLLPFEALTEVSKVYAFGAAKYNDHNWRLGFAWSRLLAAAIRHIFAWAAGEDKDPESGLSHLVHAAFNILSLISFELTANGTDDRWKGTNEGNDSP